ncbi:uncharacterized protein LOC126906659 [Daktulosphaira vitifoliae]|uniref:uncharacterized protein LOC126906659 n=1 Tax=Daktulosphaira vitifoliae TaxID=58002 RepID=UPI0021A9C1FF|nr:uncharacterized protein LOC126906659 [Daktulosphaira vitifoliae]XP_050543319.1 uncharacterized protein LOC126906659 [Daktulosphaira vitifoliae]XP_050543320.1 uncharacterized protein LOC126906659 [Daktulosphaira vitifoliae]XP_050543321.1 uncharacterized protein LOC126906659 [Daktulosphaira vitifoliae]
MRCLMVFDNLNDIVFMKCDTKFCLHIKKLAVLQNIIKLNASDLENDSEIDPDLILQIFSPMVTSQRVMNCHFSNRYSSMQCQNGTNIVFDEYLGHLFVYIGDMEVDWQQKVLSTVILFIKRICGADVSLLKYSRRRRFLVSKLLDVWLKQSNEEQCILVEAIEQLTVGKELSSAALSAAKAAAEKIKIKSAFSRVHTLIMVGQKFLTLYSSRNASDLSAGDTLFLALLAEALQLSDPESNDKTDLDVIMIEKDHLSLKEKMSNQKVNNLLVLLGQNKLKLNAVYISYITNGVPLIIIHEIGNEVFNSSVIDSLTSFCKIQDIQSRGIIDHEALKVSFDLIDMSMKKIIELFKKKNAPFAPSRSVTTIITYLTNRWEPLKKKYIEFMKNNESVALNAIESSNINIISSLKDLQHHCMLNESLIDNYTKEAVNEASALVATMLRDYTSFFEVKALNNFTMRSRSFLNINKYLEEFPGLVHFIYIDRMTHRMIAPGLEFASQETLELTKNKVWSMVNFSRHHLQNGHFIVLWRDITFTYSYFLWFEDQSGTSLKPKSDSATLELFPGILSDDYYEKLVELCFPRMPQGKVRCFELFCVHLGLATASCVLEHSRRLSATVWEVTGRPSNLLDLF